MRSKGEGSVTQRKDGTWMARFYVPCPDGSKRRTHIYRKTKQEATAAMQQEKHLADCGTPIIHDGRTVGEWLDYWLANIIPNKVKPTTIPGYEQHIRVHIKPAIGNKKLSALSPMDVQGMINGFIKNGMSVRMIQISRNVLSSALRDAMNREIVHRNVSRMVDIPKAVRTERAVWSPEHISKFLSKTKGHSMHPIFELYFTYD